jgi:hypothetical protein
LTIVNKSGKEISVLYSNDIFPPPDENNVEFYLSEENITKPDSSLNIVTMGDENAWHEYISNGKNKRLYFYIFEPDTLRKYQGLYSMYDFVQRGKYYKSQSFSENELKNRNWKVNIIK